MFFFAVHTKCFVWDSVHSQYEVILEDNVADDGEEVDKDECEHSSEHDRAPVSRHTLNHVQQSFLPINQIKQLDRNNSVVRERE